MRDVQKKRRRESPRRVYLKFVRAPSTHDIPAERFHSLNSTILGAKATNFEADRRRTHPEVVRYRYFEPNEIVHTR